MYYKCESTLGELKNSKKNCKNIIKISYSKIVSVKVIRSCKDFEQTIFKILYK